MALASYKYKTLFIHIYKCGGMTIRHAMTGGLEEILAHHSVARDVKYYMGEEWNDFFTFSFIRNPYTWMQSFYDYVITHPSHFLHEEAIMLEFNDFIGFYVKYCKIHPKNKIFGADKSVSQWEYVTEDGEVIVDYLGKVETFEQDIVTIQELTGCVFNPLVRQNIGVYNTQHIFNQKGIDLMCKHYENDFKLGNYSTELYGDAI